MQPWERISFLQRPVDADLVQRTLPPGLTVETHVGSASTIWRTAPTLTAGALVSAASLD